jgi:hypothetical protein
MAWGQVRVAITQETEKSDYTEANTYLLISLSSSLLKTMKNIHIRDNILKEYPSHRNQYAFQIGINTEIALYNVVTRTEDHSLPQWELLAEVHLT